MVKHSLKLTPRGKAIRAKAIMRLRSGEKITKKEIGHLAESFGSEKKHEKKHGKYRVSGKGDAKSFLGEEKHLLLKKKRSRSRSGSAHKVHKKSGKKSSGKKKKGLRKMSKKEKMSPFGKKGKWLKNV